MEINFVKEMHEQLEAQISIFEDEVVKCVNAHAKQLCEKIKADSPVGKDEPNPGTYKSNWATRKAKKSHSGAEAIVYNKSPTYRLTHLLEEGHDYVEYVNANGFRTTKEHGTESKRIKKAAKPIPHIEKNAKIEVGECYKELQELAGRNK